MSSWSCVGAVFCAAALLLVGAGATKVLDPAPLVRALRSAGWPVGAAVVRLLAGAEVVIGVLALWRPGRWTALAAALAYAGFTAFVLRARSRDGVLSSCGCFGKADTPPTPAHVGVTAAAAVAALVVAVDPPGEVWSGGQALALGLGAALIAALAWMVLAVLPMVTPAAIRSAGRG
jgi:hypothetical protein